MYKVGLVSLGCAKNLVDSEMILGMLSKSKFLVVNNPEDADVIIINTCGFIDESKKESINTILEMSKYNKKLVVTGCLVERYLEELKASLPEVSLFIPLKDYPLMNKKLCELLDVDHIIELNPFNRLISTGSFSAYLRISEGCNNCCTYCAIPLIRGHFKSRSFEDVIKEAKMLKKNGIKELILISQDVTHYGSDLTPHQNLSSLLKAIVQIGFYSIRLLYLYPEEIDDELILTFKNNPTISPYFDIPIQHCNDEILKNMNRRGDKQFLTDLFNKIRKIMPNAILRTTLIVGFPGESDTQFNELLDYVKQIRFDHLGAFEYSREEGTISYSFKNQVSRADKESRYKALMETQKVISYENNKKHINEIMQGIIVDKKDNNTYLLRSYWNAPDDVDGNITFTSQKSHSLGDIVDVKIISAFVYDLYGKEIE
jgi:ribosomal protein S12 methylthiotransferase